MLQLQTRDYFPENPIEQPLEESPDHPLRRELGWPGVATGLLRVLAGYFILLGGMAACVGLFMVGMASDPEEALVEGTKLSGTLYFFLGMIVAGFASLVSYYYVLSGKWRCAINAAERNNARWLIFGCMVCVLLGPTISTLSSVFGEGGVSQEAQFDAEGNLQINSLSSTTIMQIVGMVIGLASAFCFVLFLRAVAACFFDKTLQSLIDIYIVCFAIVIGFTLQLIVLQGEGAFPIFLVGIVALGWLACGVSYLVLIFLTRRCILKGAASLRSPLGDT